MGKFKSVMRRLETEHPENQTAAEMFLSSRDLLPTREEEKTWGYFSFASFWIADSFNLNTFVIASSMISAGLTWWQAFIATIVGYSMVGPLIVLNARPGAIFGITFPAVARTTFGNFGSLWPVFNRAGMACIWGVQGYAGGLVTYVLLRTLSPDWPSKIKNIMPAGTETTSAKVLAFAIYWIISLPTIWVPIHKLRWWFAAKAVIGPAVGLALFGWCLQLAGGLGPVFSQPAKLSGSARNWQMLISISSCFNNMFTLITNAPDFASRARTPQAAVWPQLIAMPMGFAITSFLGIVIASASAPMFGGEPVWNITDIMDKMLDAYPTPATRAGLFFISAGFIYVQLFLNVAANSISAGCDLTAILPRYINIRRGGYFAAIIGFCMCPWLMYKSSATFGNYLGAYGVLLSCVAGPMICDYWLVRRGHYRLADLYTNKPDGWYSYTYGINWRAYLAYLSGFAINAPGFIHTLNADLNIPLAAQRIYTLSWLTGTGVSALVYYTACYFSPPPGMSKTFYEVDESDFLNPLTHVQEGEHEDSSLEKKDEEKGGANVQTLTIG